jgi:galactokinase
MDLIKRQNISGKFTDLFASKPLAIRSPGRINLIGEHTDYNEGFVLPAAIDKEIIIYIGLNGTNRCNLFAWDLQEYCSIDLSDLTKVPQNWANYAIGVVLQLKQRGLPVSGFDCVFGGNIPIGAGLSSSAALECGIGFGLNELMGYGISRFELALIGQAAESEFVGLKCGIMDQYASLFGAKDQALLLDCREYTHDSIGIALQDYEFMLFNSNVKHELSNSEYNTRRQECEQGVRTVKTNHPKVKSLRDFSPSMLLEIKDKTVFKRCQFVLDENRRVLEGANDLAKGDLKSFGQKLYQSHHGLSERYEVSCPELDLLVELTKRAEAVLGARMMGGGFGGCTINLIEKSHCHEVAERIGQDYRKQTGSNMEVYRVAIANGTSSIEAPVSYSN